jgi:hypothetical protein
MHRRLLALHATAVLVKLDLLMPDLATPARVMPGRVTEVLATASADAASEAQAAGVVGRAGAVPAACSAPIATAQITPVSPERT